MAIKLPNKSASAKSSLSDEAEASVLIYENEIDTTKAFVDSSEMDDSSSNYSSSEVGSSSEEIDSISIFTNDAKRKNYQKFDFYQ